ncbi:SURF1 family cytochrome oxidase biogenesis protein [Amnibacterium flavum]|uniref:SURF1-like protein n=1 Tax=Amnibacterium flavum TaxID=2173173 RepID=A0A2V1HVE8_9MICO|nr:SURF1 family cytochrome oxidase biogenesis protein [Amnibacterium flavum]PVZ95039.1 hypothetical protein DDQ50_00445 [Amnibacterium flavum]
MPASRDSTLDPEVDAGTPKPTWSELAPVMRRGSSLLLLLLAIGLAVSFSALGQWQLGRAFENGAVIDSGSEDVRPIESAMQPQTQTPSDAIGQLVGASGTWQADDFSVLAQRLNDGADGYWTVGHFVTDDGVTLAVAVGWSADEDSALAAANDLAADPSVLPTDIEGRFQQAEPPTVDEDAPADALPVDMAVSSFINEWADASPAYAGYLTLREAPEGLTDIYSPKPVPQVQLNFLNLFYTVEWAVFALIALYIWYRHMRDIVEREREQATTVEGTPPAAEAPDARP